MVNPPDYICYNPELCDDKLHSNSHDPLIDLLDNNSTCRSLDEFATYLHDIRSWHSILSNLHTLFRTCSSSHQPSSIFNHPNLYSCINSSKVISKHRLVDQIKDCWYGDDESYTESCSISISNHRFKCVIKNRTVCLARVRVNDGLADCIDSSDERLFHESQLVISMKESISFSTMCDGILHVPAILIDGRNETDETECDYFPCNNRYTRCDGKWNCLNGADELNCEWPPMCPSMHHICFAPVTSGFTCLHIDHVNNGVIDCLGSTDERRICHEMNLLSYNSFQCTNSSICTEIDLVCSPSSPCPMSNDILNFCKTVNWMRLFECMMLVNTYDSMQPLEDLLCKLVYFGLQHRILYLSLTIPQFYYFLNQNNPGELQVFNSSQASKQKIEPVRDLN